jgi:protein TonB
VVQAPPPKPGTSIKPDPKHPLKIGEDYYPDASKRANEEGRCIVLMTVAADGRITNESIQTSSGFPRLDEACLKGVHGQRMLPATEDGKPVEKTVSIPIVWKLTNK